MTGEYYDKDCRSGHLLHYNRHTFSFKIFKCKKCGREFIDWEAFKAFAKYHIP